MNKETLNGFQPDYALPPGETLRETLDAIGMTQAELAERTGRPKKTINEIIKGLTAIKPETALQFERVLGVPASFWNKLESDYQEALARLRDEAQLQEQIAWVETFPIRDLVNKKWIPKKDSSIEYLKVLLCFFGIAGMKEWEVVWGEQKVAYRKSRAFNSRPASVAAWLRKGEIEARKVDCKPYNEKAFLAALKEIRGMTAAPPNVFEPAMKEHCAKAGTAVVFIPELPGTHLYGATRWLGTAKALIQLSLRGKSDDHLWFTFFHEAGHILKHGKKEVFIEAKDEGCRDMAGPDKEEEANLFAQEFLMPKVHYQQFLHEGDFTVSAVRRFAAKIGIAPGIIVGRLQHEQHIPFKSRLNTLKESFRFQEE